MNHAPSRFGQLRRIVPVILAAALAACSSITGLGGSSEFSCKAPPGVHCNSLSGNYFNLNGSAEPGSQAGARPGTVQRGAAAGVIQPPGAPSHPGALRTDGRVLRLWIKPWEDSDNDLVDQSYVYLQVDRARWQIAHVQRMARDPYAPVKPAPAVAAPQAALSGQPGQPGQSGSTGDVPTAGASMGPPSAGTPVFDTGVTNGLAPQPVPPAK